MRRNTWASGAIEQVFEAARSRCVGTKVLDERNRYEKPECLDGGRGHA
jgi:hypothetical protein